MGVGDGMQCASGATEKARRDGNMPGQGGGARRPTRRRGRRRRRGKVAVCRAGPALAKGAIGQSRMQGETEVCWARLRRRWARPMRPMRRRLSRGEGMVDGINRLMERGKRMNGQGGAEPQHIPWKQVDADGVAKAMGGPKQWARCPIARGRGDCLIHGRTRRKLR